MKDRMYLECLEHFKLKIVSEHDQEIPQSQTADNPIYLFGHGDNDTMQLILMVDPVLKQYLGERHM